MQLKTIRRVLGLTIALMGGVVTPMGSHLISPCLDAPAFAETAFGGRLPSPPLDAPDFDEAPVVRKKVTKAKARKLDRTGTGNHSTVTIVGQNGVKVTYGTPTFGKSIHVHDAHELRGFGLSSVLILIYLLFMCVSIYRLYEKGDQPGWYAFIPIYNFVVMAKIARRPTWWIALLFIPVVNIVAYGALFIAFCKAFGKGTGFAIGFMLLPFIFIPLLAFGDSQYEPLNT